jgi:hypothetical protein
MIPEFDWVKARTECSPAAVFERLKISIRSDADARTKTLVQSNANYGFSAVSEGRTISVYLQMSRSIAPEQDAHRSVVFTLTADGINVKDGNDRLICDATLTFDNDGDCRLKCGDEELELWQFRKRTLEDLPFSNPFRRDVNSR